jgi:predicted TIM-barrel fold metal-dependent hydrolase
MDSQEIAIGILSLIAPGIVGWDKSERREMPAASTNTRRISLPSLKAFAENGHILFGIDFPFAPADVAASFTAKLGGYESFTADEQTAISHGNAWTLFPRLASQPL